MCGCGRKSVNFMQIRVNRQNMMKRRAAQQANIQNVTVPSPVEPVVHVPNPGNINRPWRRIGNRRRFPFIVRR
jgi:hypothetical protein